MVDAKVAQLARCRLLRGLRPGQLIDVARCGELVAVEGGEVLEPTGLRRSSWWVVIDGLVVLAGRDTSVAGPGDSWGIGECLARRPAAATATAFERTSCLRIDAWRCGALLCDVPDLAVNLLTG